MTEDGQTPDESGALGWALVGAQFAILGLLGREVVRARRAWGTTALGLLVAGVGAFFVASASRTLGQYLRAHPAPHPEGVLRTDGAYDIVRHPIYFGLLSMALGGAIIARTGRAVAALVALGALFHVKSRLEERLLAERFPAYAEYAARVPRLLPHYDRCPYPLNAR